MWYKDAPIIFGMEEKIRVLMKEIRFLSLALALSLSAQYQQYTLD